MRTKELCSKAKRHLKTCTQTLSNSGLSSASQGLDSVLQPPPPLKTLTDINREAPVRFGSVAVRGWNGSSGSGFRFRRLLCKKRLFCVSVQFATGKDSSGSGFASWKTVPAVPVPLPVSGRTVPTVPVPGSGTSGSVPESPCNDLKIYSNYLADVLDIFYFFFSFEGGGGKG